MVAMHFETVSQTKTSVALNDIPDYGSDYIRLNLDPAAQTNANQFILHIPSIADSQPNQISLWYFVY